MQRLAYRRHDSPVGPLGLLVDAQGALVCLSFLAARGEEELERVASRHGASYEEDEAATKAIAEELDEYFAGERRAFAVPLRPLGTEFQHKVWAELVKIPFAETRSYGELAKKVGSPGGFRAVGRANGTNPIAIVIPCHRVIGADGSLTGFGGGLDSKQRLLLHERQVEAGWKTR